MPEDMQRFNEKMEQTKNFKKQRPEDNYPDIYIEMNKMSSERDRLEQEGKKLTDILCFCCPNVPPKTKFNVTQAIIVRIILMGHVLLSTWRVTLEWNDLRFWLFTLGAVAIVFEGHHTVLRNRGLEEKWFCPLYAVYLAAMLPLIWLLEVHKTETFISTSNQQIGSTVIVESPILTTSALPAVSNITANITKVVVTDKNAILTFLESLDSNTWIVVVEELLVYLIVLGRWLLPRNDFSKEALSDLLIEYLGIASDIMEFLALFDEDIVRGSWEASYAVLSVWTISFFQFIPVFADRESQKRAKNRSKGHCFKKNCGESFIDILSTCMALFLQDGPFLAVRLYIILHFDLITYSLVFFVLKNSIVVLLLTYKLGHLLTKLPCCFKKDYSVEGVEDVDMENPLAHNNFGLVSSIDEDIHFSNEDKQTPIFKSILENENIYKQNMKNRLFKDGSTVTKNGDTKRAHKRNISGSTRQSTTESSLLPHSVSVPIGLGRWHNSLSLRKNKFISHSLKSTPRNRPKPKHLPLTVRTADGAVLKIRL